ncbi:MAG: 23S rRNA (guanosine(2251)-2'-O)-methyltransferase RlmB [Bacteroidetes bacterium]|nr:23S rRNA (guanosine(2251)-2'-O)-methyltransferase RlmB [Bacteroidota bacterium]
MTNDNFIYGIHPVIEAIKAGKEIDKLFVQKGLKGEGFHLIYEYIKELEIPFQFVPVEKLNRMTRQNHQGIIAYISEISYQKLDLLIPYVYEQGRVPLLLVLDKITDVRNLGAIARTAECAGVDGLLLPSKGSAQINADAIKTSAGALYKLPVSRCTNLKESIQYMKNSGLRIFAATEKATISYTEADFTHPMALILGSEDIGISDEYLKLADDKIGIPLYGEIESLNVSVATGILLYEILRQRNKAS